MEWVDEWRGIRIDCAGGGQSPLVFILRKGALPDGRDSLAGSVRVAHSTRPPLGGSPIKPKKSACIQSGCVLWYAMQVIDRKTARDRSNNAKTGNRLRQGKRERAFHRPALQLAMSLGENASLPVFPVCNKAITGIVSRSGRGLANCGCFSVLATGFISGNRTTHSSFCCAAATREARARTLNKPKSFGRSI